MGVSYKNILYNQQLLLQMYLLTLTIMKYENGTVFPRGGTGGPPSWRKFGRPPHSDLVPIFRPEPAPPPDICPRKFSKF